MVDVLYQGEWVDKNWLNMWLNTPEGRRIHEKQEAREKAAAEEERKKQQQLQKQKQAASKSKEKKIQEYFHKYRQEYGPDASISDELAHMLWQRAHNAVEAERRDEEYQKQREYEQRQMEESIKRKREQREREAQARRKAYPVEQQRQVQMILSGERDRCSRCHMLQNAEFFGHTEKCPIYAGTSLEPGIALLRKEFSTGEIIKRVVGQEAYNRLVEFGKPGETWESLMNRLLDVAMKATAAEKNGLTIY